MSPALLSFTWITCVGLLAWGLRGMRLVYIVGDNSRTHDGIDLSSGAQAGLLAVRREVSRS